jgi:hypothetical protein
MISRCTNPKVDRFDSYGGRGITVCDRWRTSFTNFYDDLGPRPSPQHSLDRIDVNGNYEPGNVRWATPLEQAQNKRPVSEWRPRKINRRDAKSGKFVAAKAAA